MSQNNGAVKTESSSTFTSDYNYCLSQTDARGNTASYTYDTAKGLLLTATDPKGNTRSYTYDSTTDIQLSVSGNADVNTPVTTEFGHTDDYALETITRNDTVYSYQYDSLKRVTSTKVGTQTLASNSYDSSLRLSRTDFANGDYYEPEYDSLDRVSKRKYNGDTAFSYKYNVNNQVAEIDDAENGKSYKMQYDLAGRLTDIVGSDGTRATLAYDTKGNMQSLIMKDGGNAVSAALYSFLEDNNLLDKINLPLMDNGEIKYSYGDFNRVDSISHTLKESNQNLKVKTEFEYLTSGTNQTGLVGSMSNKRYNGTSLDENFGTFSYTYDANGNIATISEDGTLKVTYTYDGLNQLVREDNAWLDASYTYTYDEGGNILEKNEYEYSTGELGELYFSDEFTYGDPEWKDKLTSVGDMEFTYDENGNLLNLNGLDFIWEKGRQLAGIAAGDYAAIDYKYNSAGLRTQKTVSGVTTEYTYAGNLLMSQDDGTNRLDWVYAPNGQMIGFKLNGETNYYYLRNLQGDVIGIYDSDGEIVCRYLYDTWGALIDIYDSEGNSVYSSLDIALINPIRYRGYYYDTEIGMYYLQSRYYIPQLCRFINADALFVAGDSLAGSNMFAYCNNNPVMFIDPTGYDITTWDALIYALTAFFGRISIFISTFIFMFKGNDVNAGETLSKPENLDASIDGNNVKLTWDPAVSSESSDIIKYEVRMVVGSFSQNFGHTKETYMVIGPLQYGQTYEFWVRAVVDWTESEWVYETYIHV